MKISYSSETKKALSETVDKKNCCRRMYSDGIGLKSLDDRSARVDIIRSAPQHFRCDNCFPAFLRGLFVAFGNVTDPAKQYHLELSLETEEECAAVGELLLQHGIEMKRGARRSRQLLYIKNSELIEDFFAVVGANKAAFELINSKIVREVRGDANRQSNCDMANIKKSLSASKKYTEVIEKMISDGTISRLPKDLSETAMLRIENTQASMSDLALMHKVPISKSGVKHRLDKIADIAAEIYGENT